MPELPEVNNIVGGLNKRIINKKITNLQVNYSGILKPPDENVFKKSFLGKSIFSIDRHGKYIKIVTSKKDKWLIHLRMTGQIFIPVDSFIEDRHVHAIFYFEDGSRLVYRDIRKFGKWLKIPEGESWQYGINAGTDALDISLTELKTKMDKYPKRKIKAFLLDQTILAGVGNIYADEICFDLRIDPETFVSKVDPDRLHQSINTILHYAIKHKGSSFSDYIGADGEKGNFQNLVEVYRQKYCKICGMEISRKKVAGRTTHFCSKCQS